MTLLRFAFIALPASFLITSCGAYLNQPYAKQVARTGETSSTNKNLKNLPKPLEPIVAGIYNFRDQTGQYKNVDVGSSFSTAVPQGGTTILAKALEDSGWFTIVERENLGNLLNERNIINTTREQFRQAGDKTQSALPPLLFAGILLEGGITSYDSNIITGGTGARYFGVGGSTQYREDRLTVYLRAVSTTNGKVLKTVYVSKTILSQAVSANLFRYVNFQRLLEVETGFTSNEPVQLALKEAIEKAVESLIIEGIAADLWKSKEEKSIDDQLVTQYNKLKEQEESTLLYNREQFNRTQKNEVSASSGVNVLFGDYKQKKAGYSFRISYARELSKIFSGEINFNAFELVTGKSFKNHAFSLDLNLRANLLPNDKISPYVYLGPGMIGTNTLFESNSEKDNPIFWKMQYGLGLNYNISNSWGVFGFAEHNLSFTDKLDNLKLGKRNDYYFNFGLGLKYYF
ncbi:CsgG/HfaB family protein [Myroides marinus]|uniref:CsgG/HfaB family protein n=1 Tax=Myroides TaxID=76831 RepID=UPI00074246AE|nr:CsgG/HfaB family protein [Myroides marinus]KUF42553.1 hypothetical protein AS361_15420 [Myroides marinus]MDM1369393.1 outer membrane beta-barrel protein [Myroides marinus]MDM1404586.1 outer membrane beta-barrel protein [Myroides marinus]